MTRTKVGLALAGAIAVAGCSGGGGGGGGDVATGAYTINLDGAGSATTLAGGYGGYFYAETSQPGGVKLTRSGEAATAFDVPPVRAAYDSGPNGATVTSSTTAVLLTSGADDPGGGALYVMLNDGVLYKGDGLGTVPDSSERVTGLSVRPGATLTLELNFDGDMNGTPDMASLAFANDVEIAGTLEAAGLTAAETRYTGTWDARPATSRDSGAVYLEAQQLLVRAGGRIDLRGGDAAAGSGEHGGCGGYLEVHANNLVSNEGTIDTSGGNGDGAGDGGHAGLSSARGGYLALWAAAGQGPMSGGGGMILNRGRLLASGGDGASGGAPVEVRLQAYSHVVNGGELAANGGRGTTGEGGDADLTGVLLTSEYGSVLGSGPISTRGGDGATGGGGGGNVYLYAANSGSAGDIVSAGAITTSGGGATVGGSGGYGGRIGLYARGAVRTSGALTLAGGAAAGAGTSGGQGGYLEMYAHQPSDWFGGYALPVREIQISGNLVLTGGAAPGGYGGGGGALYVVQAADGSGAYGNAGIEFLGYRAASLSGGDGLDAGGAADNDFEVYTYSQWYSDKVTPAGPIENEVDVTMRGGSCVGTEGAGGSGGFVHLEVSDDGGALSSSVRNSGALDTSGGDSKGTSSGADSGGVQMYSPRDVVNAGRILNRGGDAEAWGGSGNYWELWLVAGEDVVNSGSISTTGGSGADGGNGSDGWSYHTGLYAGGQVTNTGALESRGGTSTDPVAGTAGDGGHIELFGQSRATSNGASLDVAPGTGGVTPGNVGEIWIDWVNVTPASGIL